MAVFAISDLHLSMAEGIEKPMSVFGEAWVDYENRLKENWQNMISGDDVVIIPGDISWALHLEDAKVDLSWVDSLPGTKILLRGNHDPWWSSMKKMRSMFESIKFVQNDAFEIVDYVVFGSRGWLSPGDKLFNPGTDKKIFERECIRLRMAGNKARELQEKAEAEGRKLTVIGAMHFPPLNDKKQLGEFHRIFKEFGAEKVVYGHLHGEYVFPNGPSGIHDGIEYINVAVDKLKSVPYRLY